MHDELLNDFLEESYDLIEKVKVALSVWGSTEDKVEGINSIYRWVHTIKGGCAIFEYKETMAMAHELETFLGRLKGAQSVVDEDLQKVREEIYLIEASLRGEAPIEMLAGDSGGPDFPKTPGIEVRHFQDYVDNSGGILEDLMNDGFRFFEIILPRAVSAKLVEKLQEHDILTMETRDNGEESFCFCSICPKGDEALVDKAQKIINKYQGHWCETPKAIAKITEQAQEMESEMPKDRPAQPQEVLRVPLSTVNSILDHVWELFLVRNQLAHLFNMNRDSFKDNHAFIQQFDSLDNVLERNIQELESKTMSLRLNPIKKVFDRMEKVVREYCQQTDKKINFVTRGEGIDLDKKILDQLNGPLIHLIRNAIDHGIESPEARVIAGKESRGLVELSAQLQGNEVHILITDDGKGIDPERLLKSAKDKNLDVSHIKTEQEILGLIFSPGFSTADKVTNVSGRGVGMDAVKSSLQELGGNVDLTTKVGKGTTFKVTLPLAMSVTKSLIVSVQGIEYALSTKSITSVEKISVFDLKSNGEDLYYNFNGTLIPCLRPAELLPDHRTEPDLPVISTHVCVTSVRGQDVAFMVDDIIQTLNLVLKPLPKGVQRNSFIAGVSILPGGNPIFALNVRESLMHLMDKKIGESYANRAA